MSAEEAIADIALGEYERGPSGAVIAPNVFAVYQRARPDGPRVDVLTVFGKMAELEGYADGAPA